jgi:hypothetical protein
MKSIFMLIACALLIACSGNQDDKSALTYTSDGTRYINDYFELEITKPNDWYSQDPESTMKMSQVGANIIAGEDRNMKAMMDESLKSSLPIFAFFEQAPGTPTSTNPNIVSVAENISLTPGIKSGCDYLFHARKLMEKSTLNMTISEGCQTLNINGAILGYFDTQAGFNGIEVKQKYYACVKGEHAIAIIQTYFDDTSKAAVDRILNSIQVKCS